MYIYFSKNEKEITAFLERHLVLSSLKCSYKNFVKICPCQKAFKGQYIFTIYEHWTQHMFPNICINKYLEPKVFIFSFFLLYYYMLFIIIFLSFSKIFDAFVI